MSIDDTINSLINQIRQKEAAIRAARNEMSAALATKRTYESRRDEVRRVKTALEGTMNSTASSISKEQRNAVDRVKAATSGLSHEQELSSQISSDYEKETESDATCLQIHTSLQAELLRCEQEIDAASERIRNARWAEANAQNSRSSLVREAKNYASQEDATVKVYESERY